MKLYKHFTLMLAMMMTLTACPTRHVQRQPHEGPVTEKPDVVLPSVDASSAHFNEAKIEGLQAAVNNEKSDLFKSVITPLLPYLMNPSYVENPAFSGTLRMRTMLNLYNRALLKLIETNPALVASEQLLEKYNKMLFSGCDDEVSDLIGCVNIKFYRVDHLTSKIVQKIAGHTPDVRRYYKLLAFAYELQNRTKDRDLEFMYFLRAREYSKYLASLPEGDRQKPLIRRHGIIFETLLRDFVANPGDPNFRKFVFEFEPWNYSRLTPNTFRYGTQRLFQLVAENYLYEKNGRLNSDLVSAMAASQTSADPLGASFSQIVEQLDGGEYGNVLKDLGVDTASITDKSVQDEYFFVVDRLYRGHLSVDEAIQIWLGSKRKSTRLLEIIQLYIRVQIVKKIVETNEFMAEIYANPQFDSTTMIKTVLEKSKDISDKWMDMLERVELLKRLVNSQLRTFGKDTDELKVTNKMFDSIRRNIKYMAVYPNMFLMSYFLARNKAKFKVYSWYGEFEIDHTSLINGFMEGLMAPWFRFGNDELPLGKIEMMYAYYFALNNGSFETFGKIKDSDGKPAIDRVRFLGEIVKEYIGSENSQLREALEKQKSLFASNSYSQFLEYCARDKAGNRNFSVEMDFFKIGAFAYIGGGTRFNWAPMAETPYSFYKAAMPALNGINTSVRLKLTVVRTMIDILKDDMLKRGLSKQQTEAWTKKIENIVAETEKARQAMVNDTIERHREIGDCVERARRIEAEHQDALYAREIFHLKSVYADLKALQSVPASDLAAKEVAMNQKYGFTADPAVTNGNAVDIYKLDVITQRYYRYSKYELFVRMMKRMGELRPAMIFNLPSDLNLSVDFYRNKEGNPINFLDSKGQPVSEDEFVSNGMRYLSGLAQGSYLSWASETMKNEFNDEKIKALSVLYQITYGNPEFTDQIQPQEVIGEVMNMVELAKIRNQDVIVLNYMGRERRASLEDLRRFVIDNKSNEELPAFENAFKLMTKTDTQLLEAKQFHLAMKHSGYFLFAPSKEVIALMGKQYRPLVDGVRLRSKDAIAAARAEAAVAEVSAKLADFPYELKGKDRVYYRAGVLLNERSVKDVKASERDFDRETENYFQGGQ